MNAEEYLNSLFDSARNAAPESSVESIRLRIEQPRVNVPQAATAVSTKIIITMSTLILLFGGIYFLFNQPEKVTAPAVTAASPKMEATAPAALPPRKPAYTKYPVARRAHKSPKQKYTEQKVVVPVSLGTATPTEALAERTQAPEPDHIIVPYVPNFKPEGVIDPERCFTASTRSINMLNVHLIELSREELLPLGIEVTEAGIEVTSNTREGGKPLKITYSKAGSSFDVMIKKVIKSDSITTISESVMNSGDVANGDIAGGKGKAVSICEEKEVKISITAGEDQAISFPKFDKTNQYPDFTLITDDLGQKWRAYQVGYTVSNNEVTNDPNSRRLNRDEMLERAKQLREQAEQDLRTRIAGFIPILVRSGQQNDPADKSNRKWRADIIVWFEPTEKLFQALPARVSDELRKEYQSVFVTKEGSSCTYFEACKNVPGAIENLNVFPNPTDDLMSIEFGLKDSRTLSASLYTINGVEIKPLFKNQVFEKGTALKEYHINDLQEGIYLLIIESGNGDVVSRRIIRK